MRTEEAQEIVQRLMHRLSGRIGAGVMVLPAPGRPGVWLLGSHIGQQGESHTVEFFAVFTLDSEFYLSFLPPDARRLSAQESQELLLLSAEGKRPLQ